MKPAFNIAVYIIIALFVTTLAVAFYHYRQFPALAVAVEESPGTWLSDVLLSCSAGIALILSIHRGWKPWALVAVFLFLLAADEHFMLHERAKQWLAFNIDSDTVLIREMPVFVGTIIGGWIAWMLWKSLEGIARKLLQVAVFSGIISVMLDVFGAAAMWEELMKLVAELAITCGLLLSYKKGD